MGPVVMMAMVLLAVQRLATLTSAAILNSAPRLPGEAGDDKVDTAVVADCFQHSACQQGDDDKFAHTGDTRSHSAEPIEESGACIHVFGRSDAEDAHCRANADDSRRDDAK